MPLFMRSATLPSDTWSEGRAHGRRHVALFAERRTMRYAAARTCNVPRIGRRAGCIVDLHQRFHHHPRRVQVSHPIHRQNVALPLEVAAFSTLPSPAERQQGCNALPGPLPAHLVFHSLLDLGGRKWFICIRQRGGDYRQRRVSCPLNPETPCHPHIVGLLRS